jgi:HEPN domain-containing protein
MATREIKKTGLPFTAFSMEADHDYLLARMISTFGGGFGARAGYFGQQACEKYLKALSVQQDGTYLESHELLTLAAKCEPSHPFLAEKEAREALAIFDVFDQVGRYGAAANYDPLSKGKKIGGVQMQIAVGAQVAGAWAWMPEYLHHLDGIVFNMRGRLDFAKVKWPDSLKAILQEDPHNHLNGTWEGPLPLKEVLLRDNRYFTLYLPEKDRRP